jgi:phosphoesterase RecJ-like protein
MNKQQVTFLIQNFDHLCTQINRPQNIVITTPKYPRLHTMANALALYHFLKSIGHTVTIISLIGWPSWSNWLPGFHSALNFDSHPYHLTQNPIQHADLFFDLDQRSIVQTLLKKAIHNTNKSDSFQTLINYHTIPNQSSFFVSNSPEAMDKTVAEIIYHLILSTGHKNKIDYTIALCLCNSLMGNHRHLYPSSGQVVMIEYFGKIGVDTEKIYQQLIIDNPYLYEPSFDTIKHLKTKDYPQWQMAFAQITKEDFETYHIQESDLEELVCDPLHHSDTTLSILCIEGFQTKIKLRSTGSQYNVHQIAKNYFNGAGIYNDADAKSDMPLQQVVDDIMKIIEDLNSPA